MKRDTTINACLKQTGIAQKTTTEAVCGFNQKEKIMKNLRSFLIVSIMVFAALLSSAPFVSAQQMADEPTAVELDQFRFDLAQMLQEMDAKVATLERHPLLQDALAQSRGKLPKTNKEVTAAQKQIQTMTYEELAIVYRAFETHFPKWRETPQIIDRIAAKLKNNNSKNSKVIGRDITPNAITPDNCQDAFNAAPSFTDYSAATAAAIAADGLQNVIPPPFNAIATGVYIAAAEGALVAETLNAIYDRCSGDRDTADILTSIGNVQTSADTIVSNANTNATNILNSISSATTTITNNDDSNKTMLVNNAAANTTTITNAVTSAKNDIVNNDNSNKTMITTAITNAQTAVITAGDANSAAIINNDNSNKTMIVNNDNANATTLNTNLTNAKNTIIANDNTNTTNIVNNDNANKTMIVNNDNANAQALQDALLRSQIEADLATESNGVKVAWYMTPTANGGKLDLVKSIVTLTLANIQAAGGSIGNAQSFLDKANAEKAAGNFKSAYDNYRKAYKAAAN